MAEPTEVVLVLLDVTEKARAAAANLKSMAEEVPETDTASKLVQAHNVMVAQNKLLRITVEALLKHEDRREEILRAFDEQT